jgi:hypothetical protein
MSTITCAEAQTLINEAASLGCRSPWEVELAKLALENRIADYLAGGGATRGAIRTITATGSIVSGDYAILADSTSGAITINLPTAAILAGRIFVFKRVNAGANNVVIDPAASETIDGAATYTLSAQWASVTIISNGTNWFII